VWNGGSGCAADGMPLPEFADSALAALRSTVASGLSVALTLLARTGFFIIHVRFVHAASAGLATVRLLILLAPAAHRVAALLHAILVFLAHATFTSALILLAHAAFTSALILLAHAGLTRALALLTLVLARALVLLSGSGSLLARTLIGPLVLLALARTLAGALVLLRILVALVVLVLSHVTLLSYEVKTAADEAPASPLYGNGRVGVSEIAEQQP